MQMYFMLRNIHNSVATSPSDQGASKFKLEDALGTVRELPYEWFRHWEVCLFRLAQKQSDNLVSLSKDCFKLNSRILRAGGKSWREVTKLSTKTDQPSLLTRANGLSQ
jgi:hypothetical protein